MIKKKHQTGFTLVELIVVLVILAILIALLVPVLTGYIAKAHERAAMTECGQCVKAAQALGSERYGTSETVSILDKDEIQKDAEVEPGDGKGIGQLIYSDHAKVTLLVYTSSHDITVQYKDGKFTIINNENGLGKKETMDDILAAFKENMSPGGNLDSGASNYPNSQVSKILKVLKEKGIDLQALGAETWNYKNNILVWIPTSLDGVAVGTKLPVMRYNYNTGNYTVWYATVQLGTTGTANGEKYPILSPQGSGYSPSTSTTADGNQTYDKMVQWYQKALAEN